MAWIDRRPGVRPRPSLGRRLDLAARACFPAGATVLLMLLAEAPLGLTGQAALQPAMALGCVWFWSLHQPQYMPPPVVFLIGLLLDLLGYLPFGVGTLTLLMSYGIAAALRRYLVPRGFGMNWLAFVPIAVGAALLMWLLMMILLFRLLSPVPVFFQAIVTIALYPALAVPFGAARRGITDTDRA
ncbi:rod shape-determining protein MreD [Rhodopila sp.]|jgi:rod shape-determining protein MreD|uniref:rod shape-determining protein MreD n=1 Tax=Rhodopila sp. TaxID=2480087 RepID=UPI002C07B813|nr:rod shape-determining protein MreD [Rhodopila sp.]HVZ07176.1 rod shape-determining protein MreD [Rhodopila sp.]